VCRDFSPDAGGVQRRDGPPSSPVVIEATTVASASGSPIEIVLPGGQAVRVGAGFDAETLRRVLAVMGEA
jgi:hypothetical protein